MIAFLLLVKLLIAFVLADDRNESLPTRRMYYGETAKIEDYPYFAGLWNCGAVILSNTWVATAGHCVFDARARGSQHVYVGGNTIKNSTTLSYVDVIVHPEYKEIAGMTFNDIALLKLTAPLRFSERIQPAKLPTSAAPRNVVLVSRGTDETGKLSTSLKKVDRIILSPLECVNMMSHPMYAFYALQNREYLQRKILCSKRHENLPSVCGGDSGSPLLSGDTLVGIVAFGLKSCEKARLGFDTYVLNFVPWIRSHTGL
ncbi:chymotrypsin-1-like [Maniola jurtina]|uniref:chymotrypsin-1-like n=1 Tax=Maniola jurtina TaxID=191418 RepID=UPI001E688D58|nr:chymotrypsin-1-like [Maniola jurtina]